MSQTGPSGPLKGYTVLDLSRILSGPYCSMMLADLGADVIKVERPGVGDDARHWGPPFIEGEAAYFLSVNRNKRSIAVNLKDEDGLAVVRRLVRRADVVLENFRPGTAARLGLGYEDVKALNPGIIYASISGFGQDGPYRDKPGYDAIAQGMGGLMSLTGEPGRGPVRAGVAIADIGAGMWTAFAILAALLHREQTGEGQHVDVALMDGQIAWLTYQAGNYFATGQVPQRYGTAHPNIVPYQAFPAEDGYFMVAVGNDSLWQRFCPAVGLDDLVDDPRFATNPDRVKNRDQLLPLLEDHFRQETANHWMGVLEDAGVPVGPIHTLADIASDPHVAHRQMVQELEHPRSGSIRVTGVPVKLSQTPGAIHAPPPLLGAHTDAVLRELGFDEQAVQRLREQGAVE